MRALIKQILPPFLHAFMQRIYRRMLSEPPSDPKVEALKKTHNFLNLNCNASELVFRQGLRFRLHPESIEPFLAFCYLYPNMVAEMDAFLHLINGKKRLLDVGALHGVFSLAFVAGDLERRAVAVDASPIAFARLLYNIHHNAPNQVEPVECALSSENGTVEMHYEWEHAVAAGTGSVSPSRAMKMISQRGDDLCQSRAFEPDLIKIDVEGHEVKVLRGLETTIVSWHPLIFLELHPLRIQQEGDFVSDIVSMIANWQYEAFHLDGSRVMIEDISIAREDMRLVLRHNFCELNSDAG